MTRHSFIQMSKLSNVKGRISYITSHARQENLYATYRTADVIGTYVYRVGLGEGQFSYTTAVNLFMSIIGFTLTYLANRLSNYLTGSGLW